MYLVAFLSILSQEPWTQSDQAHSDKFSDQTTSCSVSISDSKIAENVKEQSGWSRLIKYGMEINKSMLFPWNQDKAEQETTGPRATTQREPNWSTQLWMLSERRRKAVTVFRDFNLHTHWAGALVLVWEHYSSAKSARNTPTESWTLFPLSHLQKYPTPWWNPTTLPSLFTNLSRTPTKHTALITRLYMTSASVHSNLPPQHTATSTISSQLPCPESQHVWDSQVNI